MDNKTDKQLSFLNELNMSQREAVEYCDGPSLIVAGAGSGKTRVLTYKIAYLLERQMNPWNILALTFTNKAAKEMRERISALVGIDSARRIQMGTFHSVFARILRMEASAIGYQSNFTIYDEADSRSLVKRIIKEQGLDEKQYKPARVHDIISRAKNALITAEEYGRTRDFTERDKSQKIPSVFSIYSSYEAHCKQANAMDFDDLLMNTYVLFHSHKEIRDKYAERFHYILIDEYQDTNSVQQAVILQLVTEKNRVCAVGDDYQSIYSFRGANINNILDFQQKFKGTKVFKLERNYRSTQLIVQAANSLMKKNRRQIPKEVYSEGERGECLVYQPSYSDREEAAIVAQNIERIKRTEKCSFKDFAILYRTNAQSRSFEDALRKESIPYAIVGGLGFYQRKEIKDILAYFRLVVNPDDEEAFVRIVNYPKRGIGNATIQNILNAAKSNQTSLWNIISSPYTNNSPISKVTYTKLQPFCQMIEGFRQHVTEENAFQLGKEIIKVSGIATDIYSSKEPEYLSKQENLEEFLNGIQSFVSDAQEEGREERAHLTDYLQEVALASDTDKQSVSDDSVIMMTIHAAKGLEFPTVFVVGLEENIFPSQMANESRSQLEEERRLLYVAITRAEKHCFLTNAKNRFRYGQIQSNAPSRFLSDIDPVYLNNKGGAGLASTFATISREPMFSKIKNDDVASIYNNKPTFKNIPHKHLVRMDIALSSSNSLSSEKVEQIGKLSVGTIIEHQRFGVGEILGMEGEGENTKATVKFQHTGTKQLLLKFAKFKIIG